MEVGKMANSQKKLIKFLNNRIKGLRRKIRALEKEKHIHRKHYCATHPDKPIEGVHALFEREYF